MSILSEQDWDFIDTLNDRFPYMRQNFEAAVACPATLRFKWAMTKLAQVKRSGFVVRGVPLDEVETVLEHTTQCASIASMIISDLNNAEEIKRILLVHDISESIVLDFHRNDPISKKEKHRLESLAAKIIFEHDPEDNQKFYNLYLENMTLNAHRAHDIDKIQILFRTLEYYREYPHLSDRLNEFWDWYAQYSDRSDIGDMLFEMACEQQERLLKHATEISLNKPEMN